MTNQKGCLCGSQVGGSDDEVAFIFTVGGVEDDNELSLRCFARVLSVIVRLEISHERIGNGLTPPKDSTASGMLSNAAATLSVVMSRRKLKIREA
jgi:hypothetical protein